MSAAQSAWMDHFQIWLFETGYATLWIRSRRLS